jgi:hypothetical protein
MSARQGTSFYGAVEGFLESLPMLQ